MKRRALEIAFLAAAGISQIIVKAIPVVSESGTLTEHVPTRIPFLLGGISIQHKGIILIVFLQTALHPYRRPHIRYGKDISFGICDAFVDELIEDVHLVQEDQGGIQIKLKQMAIKVAVLVGDIDLIGFDDASQEGFGDGIEIFESISVFYVSD